MNNSFVLVYSPIFTKHNTRISILANLSFRTDKYLNLNIENVLLQCKQQLSNQPSLVTNQADHWFSTVRISNVLLLFGN
jgi:hypothetical protein